MNEGYHGWKNWETWNVYSWLSNQDAQHGGLMEQAKDLLERYEDEDCSAAVLAESVKVTVSETENPLTDECSLYHDLLSAALEEVDWVAIAHHFVGEAICELHDAEPCEREPDDNGWWCVNDHTGCMWNDGNNGCNAPDEAGLSPLEVEE